MRIQKILVPTDFSTFADIALDYALELAQSFEARVTLLHVYQLPLPALDERGVVLSEETVRTIETSARDGLAATLAEALLRWKGAPDAIEQRLLAGAPHLSIVEEALRGGYDLIVMGTHGRTGIRHALIGSVAERVARTAPCPVLTVPGKLGALTGSDQQRKPSPERFAP